MVIVSPPGSIFFLCQHGKQALRSRPNGVIPMSSGRLLYLTSDYALITFTHQVFHCFADDDSLVVSKHIYQVTINCLPAVGRKGVCCRTTGCCVMGGQVRNQCFINLSCCQHVPVTRITDPMDGSDVPMRLSLTSNLLLQNR